MATLTVELPSLLASVMGARTVPIEGDTVAGALDAIRAAHPELARHLFDESGGFRQHVLCFHNGTNTRWLDPSEVTTSDGDVLTIVQAVSGG